jgi:UTP--glucose-1-phosphate uridylyltransferase
MTSIRTAVFPVAGFGTRFLPATKAMPKVLLPIVDRPLIQYAVDEALAAGIENLVFVTGRGGAALEAYFDSDHELEAMLRAKGDNDLASEIERLRPAPGRITYVQQEDPLGLGHAVWCARNVIGDEPFAVLLADELILSDTSNLSTMISVHEAFGGNVVLVDDVPTSETEKYGIINPGATVEKAVRIDGIVEKPEAGTAPSNLAVIGRYILDPSIMATLGSTSNGSGGEIQLTDALLASIGELPFHAVRAIGERFDCGSKLGFLDATIRVAMGREDMRGEVQRTIDELAR